MHRITAASFALACLASSATGQQVWTGYDFSFSKASFADWTLPENQDRITDTVWITRANEQGIFNIFSEEDYQTDFSPAGTEWAFGTAENWESLTFAPWQIAIGSAPPKMVGQPMVVHLIDDDIYLDLVFTGWGSGFGNPGGSFSYMRAAEPVPPACPADLDESGGVGSTDLNILLGAFGCTGGDCEGDINGDGDTNSIDLNLLLADFGQSCE